MAESNNTTGRAEQVGRWSIIAIGFSIPISVALDNVLLGVLLLCFLASGRYHEKFSAAIRNPVSVACLTLFGALAIAATYGVAEFGKAARFLMKYSDLLFVPVIAALAVDANSRQSRITWNVRIMAGVVGRNRAARADRTIVT